MNDKFAEMGSENALPPVKRKQFSTELRAAIWEAHKRRCPYTGDRIAFAELEIDHVVPITAAPKELQRLIDEQIVPADFDLNGLNNLLPTKGFQNGRKSAVVRPNNVLLHFLDIAEQHRAAVEAIAAAEFDNRKLLAAYLQLKAQADRNSLDVLDVVDIHRQQEGLTRLRHVPELNGGEDVTLINAELARELMSKPFALGGGGITQVVLQNDADEPTLCANCLEFVAAQAQGLWPLTQFDINCYGMADRNCGMLVALEHAKFAPESVLRYPRVTCRDLDRWSSAWIRQVWIEFDGPEDFALFERCRTIADLIAERACRVVSHQDWQVAIEPRKGLAVAISELFRADLDDDGAEEILVFDLAYAPHGTLRAGGVQIAKPDGEGILQPVADEIAKAFRARR
ncbi:HNH endonuclease [Sphingomonas koreensis]|uniref:HNH endonuclease n=1 Tax=Sphingomonas koreensis TaxID=93064 RepID=A0A430G4F1_9SPHN|nr:HNH endonuclease signature motif containing protein [Sphingomonas koreensis]RSY85977.1 HNH endonuclease [Sphingomonas koreensis]